MAGLVERIVTPPPANLPLLSLLSVVIPARNEEGCIVSTVEHLHLELNLHHIPHEIVVVDDGSTDATWDNLCSMKERIPELVAIQNTGLHGFGRAVIKGLDHTMGDAVVVMMADESDDCRDVVRYWVELNKGYDCIFGGRFVKGGGTIDYPRPKLILNRLFNYFLRVLFRVEVNDITNAFKAYRRDTIDVVPSSYCPTLQSHGRAPLEVHRAGLFLARDSDHVTESSNRRESPPLERDG